MSAFSQGASSGPAFRRVSGDRRRPFPGGGQIPCGKTEPMNIHNPADPMPPPYPASQADVDHAPRVEETNAVTVGELSPIGLVCDGILSTLNDVSGLSEDARMTISLKFGNILAMFREHEERERIAGRRISALKRDMRRLKEQLAVLRQEHFDRSSEKGLPGGEDGEFDSPFDDDDDEDDDNQVKSKGKRARKIPKDTEPEVIHHYPEDRSCNCCGREMPSISSWSSIQVRIVPEHVRHIRHVHHTCACDHGERCKENKPVAAKSSNYIMKGRGIDAFFAAEAAIQKHHEHIPTYRMERRLRNANTNLTRQGIGKCVSHLALGHLEPLRQVLLTHVKAGAVVHADETPIRVQAPGKGKCATGYIWALCRDERNWNPEAQPAVFYEYNPSRAGTVIEGLLSDARCQFLLTDGYAGYNRLFAKEGANDGLVSARCWAHARRAFFEAFLATKSKLSEKIVRMIRKMYAVEKAARGLPAEVRLAMRQDKTLPILAEIRSELVKAEPKVQGSVKKAVSYTLNAFDALQRFAFDGRLEIDNNPVERCIRGIALTKKNSLFAGNHEAGQVWAIFYSLIESACLNRINPRSYLKWVVGEIERHRGDVDHAMLMPWHCPVGKIED